MAASLLKQQKSLLLKRINEATSISDIVSMVDLLDLEEIKRALTSRINASDFIPSRMFYQSVSIDQIFPRDVIQHIASFNEASDTKSVSKAFNKCTQQNEHLRIRERKKEIASIIGTNEESQTWIVHPTRTELTEQESDSKYKGPINDLSKAIHISKHGDTMLLHEGEYALNNEYGAIKDKLFIVDKALQVVGCGDKNKTIITFAPKVHADLTMENSMFFQNVSFKVSLNLSGAKTIAEMSEIPERYFRFENCIFNPNGCGSEYQQIDIVSSCSVDFRACSFYQASARRYYIWFAEDVNRVKIMDSRFFRKKRDKPRSRTAAIIYMVGPRTFKKMQCSNNTLYSPDNLPIIVRPSQEQNVPDIPFNELYHELYRVFNFTRDGMFQKNVMRDIM